MVANTGLLGNLQSEECCSVRALDHDQHGKATKDSNGDLKREHLDVELDKPESGGRLEGLPGLDEHRAAGATGLEVVVAENAAAVEGNNSLLVFGEESSFNAGQGDRRREKDRQSDEDGGQRDGKKGEGVVSSLLGGDIAAHEVELLVVHLLGKAEGESHSDGHDDSDLLGNGEGQAGEKESLALLAGDNAAEPRLGGGCSNHAVSPYHVDAGKTDGGNNVHKSVATESETDKASEEVGQKSVEHVVDHADTSAPPAPKEAANSVKVTDRCADVCSDRLVVDDGNLDVLVGGGLGRQHAIFLLEWGVRLVGICWWRGLDEGSRSRRFDHRETCDNFTHCIADLCGLSVCARVAVAIRNLELTEAIKRAVTIATATAGR